MLHEEELTSQIIGAAIEVHHELGPGLLESAYEECFCHELKIRGVPFRRQVPFPVSYKSVRLDCGYRADLVVDSRVVVELNFNTDIFKISMVRLVL
jgi:GxxExxY protein